ncbi:unnamed protein product, partial [Phaeothamnion confervicola]
MLPAWHGFKPVVAILAPSYASVERAFSMFKFVFGDQPTRSLQDFPKLSSMLRFN